MSCDAIAVTATLWLAFAAPADGEVGELMYAAGDQVAEGAELLKMAG